jgi:hypothetical protein
MTEVFTILNAQTRQGKTNTSNGSSDLSICKPNMKHYKYILKEMIRQPRIISESDFNVI